MALSNQDILDLDESRIRSLLIRERYYRDTSQWQKMRDSYHPNDAKTWVNITWYDGPIEEWIRQSAKVVAERINTVHSINPTEIDIRGSKALAISFCTMTNRFEYKGREYDKISTVRLFNRLEKLNVEGQPWRLLTLEAIYLRDSIVSVIPQPPETIPSFEGIEKFRKGYRYGAWLLATIGIKARDNLPEEDDRESVKEMHERNYAWLNAV